MILSTHGIVGSSIVQFNPAVPAQEFFDRVTSAGGSLTSTEQSAITTLINDLNNYGIWTKMKAIYPMVGASAAACAQNLKSSSFTGTFSSGWTFASTGVTPNGSSAYFDTTINILNDLSQNNTSISVYLRSDIANSNISIGGGDGNFTITLFPKAGGLAYTNIFTNGITNNTGNSDSRGFYQLTRIASNSFAYFKNNTKTTFNVASVIGIDCSLYLGAYNQQGTTVRYDSRENAFASIGDGLTDTEASNFYTAVQAFQTTLSRQV